MSRATSLIARLNSVLNKVGPMDRTVYKRTITQQGTVNALLGRYSASPTTVDTKLNPQPYYERIGRQHIPGGHAESMDMLSNGLQLLADDYQFILSPTAVSLAELDTPNTILVLKDAQGNAEEFRLLDTESASMNGLDVVFVAYYRSLDRPTS